MLEYLYLSLCVYKHMYIYICLVHMTNIEIQLTYWEYNWVSQQHYQFIALKTILGIFGVYCNSANRVIYVDIDCSTMKTELAICQNRCHPVPRSEKTLDTNGSYALVGGIPTPLKNDGLRQLGS